MKENTLQMIILNNNLNERLMTLHSFNLKQPLFAAFLAIWGGYDSTIM